MRKILIAAGLLLGAALFAATSSTPAGAWVGCTCVKIGQPAVCTEGPVTCTLKNGGACLLPCDYTPPKTAKAKKKKAKAS